MGAGSGSAFALLPPQNASGNWIKIVQRVPVRIALDPQELAEHPLRVGLSVTASVSVKDTSGSAGDRAGRDKAAPAPIWAMTPTPRLTRSLRRSWRRMAPPRSPKKRGK